MPSSLTRAVRIAAFAFAVASAPRIAQAIPVFANGQGVSCETCHTVYPAMTRYGMMVMMSNFQILNWHLQHQAFPTSLRFSLQSYLANHSQPAQTQVSDISLLTGGFAGRNFTWYNEQHVVEDGQIGETEQLWISWNGLLHGTNSLQVGKFHTPFPFMPAHAWTLASYLLATQTTGQNDFNPNDARWGVAFNGMSNEFMYNASYLAGSGPLQDALDYSGADNPRSIDLNVSYGGMEVPWTFGLVGIRGFAPLHDTSGGALGSGVLIGSDAFTREGVYYAYQTSRWHVQTMYYHGYDAHPDVGEFGIPLNGFMFELERDLDWQNHVLVRYDVASSYTLNRQYILELGHDLAPNVKLVGQLLVGPDQRPQFGFELGFAGPWLEGRRFVYNGREGIRVVPVGATPQAAARSRPQPAPGTARTPSGRGAAAYLAQGCDSCHGAEGQGGVGPPLAGLGERLTRAQIADHIAHPRGIMPNYHLSSATIDDLVAFIEQLRPVASPAPARKGH